MNPKPFTVFIVLYFSIGVLNILYRYVDICSQFYTFIYGNLNLRMNS